MPDSRVDSVRLGVGTAGTPEHNGVHQILKDGKPFHVACVDLPHVARLANVRLLLEKVGKNEGQFSFCG